VSEKRRRWMFWTIFLAAVIGLLLYMRCSGIGFGLGDESSTSATPRATSDQPPPQPLTSTPTPDAAAPRCQVRVDGTGVTLGGEAIEIAELAGRCAAGVELTVTGDARYGDAAAVREAVKAAGIDLLDRSR
jgi:hypothetical protein